MNEAIEFAFDGIANEKLPSFITFLAKSPDNVMNVSDSCEEERDPQFIFHQKYWDELITSDDGAAAFINLHKMYIAEKEIATCSVQIIANRLKIDVLILCASDDCNNAGVYCANEVFIWAKFIAEKFNFDDFYGGMEPAADIKTQLYSRNGIGNMQFI